MAVIHRIKALSIDTMRCLSEKASINGATTSRNGSTASGNGGRFLLRRNSVKANNLKRDDQILRAKNEKNHV
jgi:hypothetical protein